MGKLFTAIGYETMEANGEVLCVAVTRRVGRLPIQKAEVTAAGEIRIYGNDGTLEVMGSSDAPCPEGMLKKMRTHHEGLLLVEFEEGTQEGSPSPIPVAEQHIRDGFFSQ